MSGAAGFVGRNLVEQLVAGDWRVIAMCRREEQARQLAAMGADPVECDLLDPDALGRAMPASVDAVFHVAGDTTLWRRNAGRQFAVNVQGTRNMVETAARAGAGRLIHTSTWNVYGLANQSVREDDQRAGRASRVGYDRTKALAEDEVLKGIDAGLPAVIINPSHIIGRYDTHNWARMFLMVRTGTVPGIPPGSGSFCHAEQVARAHIAAVDHGQVGQHYLLGGTDASFREVFETIGELLNKPVPKRTVPAPVLRAYGRVMELAATFSGREPDITRDSARMVSRHPRVASDKAQRELGYEAVPLRTMLEDCHQWLVKEGLL
ncbi:NAD-dependent epimerase/dehydratase family protein [Ectothiorhodospiraceae bacterium WFHF3C12]|nr:NAD-dependent epimerase/dehydratase family protein [Ectothiorhodospiraceae bacterium WFHF3C12]